MTLYLLDTDAVIDYLRDIPKSASFIQELFDLGDSLCVCDVVVAELYSGLRPESKDKNKAEKLLESLIYLPTTPEAAKQAGEWRYQYARRGLTLSVTDALIAAIGYAHQASIVTGNLKDYPMSEISLVPLPRVTPPKK